VKPHETPTGNPLKGLKRKQKKHKQQLAKIEATSTRLERRKVKLQALESQIFDLERRAAGAYPAGNGKSARDRGLKHALLIFNPTAGKDATHDNAARLSHIVSSLRGHGIRAKIELKSSGKTARAIVRKAVDSKCPLVIVAAGDGTIGDVATQLVGSSTVLGIVPIGTMNNIGRCLGVPLDIDDACSLIGMGTTRHIDIGCARSDGKPQDEYFLESAGVGLSAIMTDAGQAFEKRHWRLLPRALRKLFEAKLGTIRVEMDDVTIEASTRVVTVSNSPLMGSNLMVAPGAKMDDGLLDIAVYDGMGDVALMKHFMSASSGALNHLKTYRSRFVRITTEEPMPSYSGSDIVLPKHVLEIHVLPKALSIIVGNGIALTMPVESAPSAPTFAPDPPHANGNSANEHLMPELSAVTGSESNTSHVR
jgi:diacylglycerol kinase (ATP)